MLNGTLFLVMATLAGPTGPARPAVAGDSIGRAIRSEVRVPPARSADAEFPAAEPGLVQEITVTEWLNEGLVLPDYGSAGVTEKGFGVMRGGSSGSPGFDTVTREYWWE